MSTLNKEDFSKALGRLESMARAQLEKSQLFHTPSDSNPGTWAGSSQEKQDAYDSSIDENGTDYNGVKKALAGKVAKGQKLTAAEVAICKGENPLKHVANKVAKGQKLTAAEAWCLKGGASIFAKSEEKPSEAPAPGEQDTPSSTVETHAGADDDKDAHEGDAKKGMDEDEDEDKDEKKAYKSFGRIADESDVIKGGLELSPFLAEQARAIDAALQSNVTAVTSALTKALKPVFARLEALEKAHAQTTAEDTEFKKSLAECVVGIATQVQGVTDLTLQAASQPARAPKSQLRALQGGNGVQVMQKSFEGGQPGDEISKADTLRALEDLIVKGKVSHMEMLRFESSGQLSPDTRSKVIAAVNSGLH